MKTATENDKWWHHVEYSLSSDLINTSFQEILIDLSWHLIPSMNIIIYTRGFVNIVVTSGNQCGGHEYQMQTCNVLIVNAAIAIIYCQHIHVKHVTILLTWSNVQVTTRKLGGAWERGWEVTANPSSGGWAGVKVLPSAETSDLT